jgi:hypothetical protein
MARVPPADRAENIEKVAGLARRAGGTTVAELIFSIIRPHARARRRA